MNLIIGEAIWTDLPDKDLYYEPNYILHIFSIYKLHITHWLPIKDRLNHASNTTLNTNLTGRNSFCKNPMPTELQTTLR